MNCPECGSKIKNKKCFCGYIVRYTRGNSGNYVTCCVCGADAVSSIPKSDDNHEVIDYYCSKHYEAARPKTWIDEELQKHMNRIPIDEAKEYFFNTSRSNKKSKTTRPLVRV